jgi:hypothetical protein
MVGGILKTIQIRAVAFFVSAAGAGFAVAKADRQ